MSPDWGNGFNFDGAEDTYTLSNVFLESPSEPTYVTAWSDGSGVYLGVSTWFGIKAWKDGLSPQPTKVSYHNGVKWVPIDELPYKTKSDGYCVFRDGMLWWFGLGEMDNEPPVSIQSTLQAETDVFLRGA